MPIAERYGVLSAGTCRYTSSTAMVARDEPHLGEQRQVEPRGFWQRLNNSLNAHLMALTLWEALQDHGLPEPGSPATKLRRSSRRRERRGVLAGAGAARDLPGDLDRRVGQRDVAPPPHIDDDDAYEDGSTAHDEYEAAMATEL